MQRLLQRCTRAVMAVAGPALLLASAPRAEAQAGIFVGAQFTGASIDLKGAADNVDFGQGFGLHAGVGLGPAWSLVVNYDRNTLARSGAAPGSVRLVQWDALGRLSLLGASVVSPFVTAGVTGRSVQGTTDFEGLAPTGGGGLKIHVTPNLALTGTALWTFGNLTTKDDVTSGNDASFRATGARVQIGASLYLFRN